MDLKQLQAMGAIVSKSLTKREVPIKRPELRPVEEWADPSAPEETGNWLDDSITVHVRKRSSADFLEMLTATDRDKPAVAILRCVCDEDGSEVFESLEQVQDLKEWLYVPLMMVVNEVNQFGPKNSQPRTSSGAKSRSASADDLSRNGKKRSAKRNARSGLPTATSAAP